MEKKISDLDTRAGFVALIGKANTGKSTLMNALVGEKLSIVTHKPQTTRKPVLGILTEGKDQLVFVDTPGILKPKYEMHRSLMAFIEDSIQGADILCVLIDAEKFNGTDKYFNPEFLKVFAQVEVPKICVINKIDLLGDFKNTLPLIAELNDLSMFEEIIPISALKGTSVDRVLDVLKSYLPDSMFYYDPELLSIQNERFFVSEMIRENIFKAYKQEIPYSTEVQIKEFKEREKGKWFISAEVIVERKTQKMIIIGSKGEKLKKIGERSRQQIEEHLQMDVFLELFVKVREKWRDNKTYLKSYGYESK